jgi:NAD(P)-dependent dehydrogenase (short-subunit alcohol dehydrogenase family)
MSAAGVLRPGVLAGARIVVAGPAAGAVAARLRDLGAEVATLGAELDDEDAVAAEVAGAGRVDVLVVVGAARFAAGGGGLPGLRTAVDGGWNAVRAVANACWVPEGSGGGKVVLLAPAPGAGPHAEATAAALENLARTLSVEWARFGVRTTAIRPGDEAAPADVAELVAYLASPAGDYFSGCALAVGV